MDSILDTIKKMLGIDPTDTAFDTDIIVNINSVFLSLNQLGVGPTSIFSITDNTVHWSDFITLPVGELGMITSYIYLKVRLMFDPPSTTSMVDALTRNIAEQEFRLMILLDKTVAVEPSSEV